ncbi:hypothetical protein WJU16_00110 [Chitinophaga pollutisoli]|uniref:Transmembrane family 220, helix n=1 Tax=Chitinophaga pollutisoli TaxID=3133966 RepID=A0ABZ2YPL0_9BACT
MRFVLAILLTALLGYILGLFLPWWVIAVAAFLVALIWQQRPGRAFASGFLAIFLLWGILAFVADVRNNHILSNRMSELIAGTRNPWILITVSAIIGGLVAGMGALSASVLRAAPKKAA